MPTTLRHRPDLIELLDTPDLDAATLGANLRDIRLINRWLGWTAAMVREVRIEAARRGLREFTILDVGTGSADIPLALVAWARRVGWRLRALAGDISPEVLAAAQQIVRTARGNGVDLFCFDATRAPFADRAVDIVICSLALHHFAPAAAVDLLRELGRVTGRLLIISDLERGWPGYLGARLLVAALRNPMTHHDAPVSVLRAYTRDEVRDLATQAGLRGARVASRFPFRLVLIWSPDDARGITADN